MTKTCVVCSTGFKVPASGFNRRKCCSRKCSSELRGSRLKISCAVCNSAFTIHGSEFGKKLCCSKECSAIYKSRRFSGEGNPSWKGGIILSYGVNWAYQRKLALKRDGYTCQSCGVTQTQLKKDLDVHHIKPFRTFTDYLDANNLDNLVSLCPSCHRESEKQSRLIYGMPDYVIERPSIPDTITPEEAADRLGLTVWAIYCRIRRGQIKAINVFEGEDRERPLFLIHVSELDDTPKPRYAKVTTEQREQIQLLLKEGVSFRRISRMTGVTYAAVRKIADA